MKRIGIRVKGIVQGVGYRPFIAVLARHYQLTGYIYNDGEGVFLEVEGVDAKVNQFADTLTHEKPPLSRIDSVDVTDLSLCGDSEFVIAPSPEGVLKNTLIAPDTAPCAECVAELNSPTDRRYTYPFINCTNCGPRYTLIKTIPYDRPNTTMDAFPMCDLCKAEYTDENNRRYHAEPIACDTCGPQYAFFQSGSDAVIEGNAAVETAKKWITQGKIVAIKGVGGYHLVCDALNDETVQRLRQRKQRPDKPLACMVGSLERINEICHVSTTEKELLQSKERPIVLLRKKISASLVAPDNACLGVMLPYAPIHYRLLDDTDVWVMTSGNISGEPVLYDDEQARKELAAIAEGFLVYNRDICAPVDDSVMAVLEEEPIFFRRSRGYVPLPFRCKKKTNIPILATGSDLKNTFAIMKEDLLFMSPHMGDLANQASYESYERTVAHYEELFSVTPSIVVSDSHPNYYSSQFGRNFAKQHQIPFMTVQHHEAHIAAVMAEYNITEPVLGIALDGTGYGEDGMLWGGEILAVSADGYKRVSHLPYTPLPGGEKAIREPWRQALWYLDTYYGNNMPDAFAQWLTQLPEGWELLLQAMKNGLPMLQTSSAGRLFDVVGTLLGKGLVHSFDGQIAMAVEQLAGNERGDILPYRCTHGIVDTTLTIQAILDGVAQKKNPTFLAASFHRTLATALVEECKGWQRELGIRNVVLGGGVFQNRSLLREMQCLWPEQTLLMSRHVPPNDGGLAMGQAWLALHRYCT